MDFEMSGEQERIYQEIVAFSSKELNADLLERDAAKEFSRSGWTKCAEVGIQGFPIPTEYGGSGADVLSTIIAMEALGFGCKDNGLVHAINSHLWGCEVPIWKFGTEQQKQAYLPPLVKGQMIGAQAITEPDSGSDVASIRTSAVKEGTSYVINGSKSIVSNAPIADLVIVFAVTAPGRKFLGGISAFLIRTDNPGVKVGNPMDKMGLRTLPVSGLSFDDCRVPASSLLGAEGSAIRIFNESMEWERSCLFACHVGLMDRILNACVRYSKDRSQFGKPIGKFQSISNKLADMKVRVELGKLLLHKIGWLKSHGKSVLAECSMAKLYISESLRLTASDAVQIFGGYGYMAEFEIERELRDSFASTIYSGTSEIHREIISRSLGI
jgi:alkylation response protein AidB-like acyl-CoA dehydrogenase